MNTITSGLGTITSGMHTITTWSGLVHTITTGGAYYYHQHLSLRAHLSDCLDVIMTRAKDTKRCEWLRIVEVPTLTFIPMVMKALHGCVGGYFVVISFLIVQI